MAGPVTKKHKRRLWCYYIVWAIIGLIPAIAGLSWRWQLAGFGWSVPGGGFLALGGAFGILMFILTLVLMLLAIVAWWLTGYAPFPFLVWGIMLVLPITACYRDSKWTFPVIWLILGAIVLYFILTRIHNHNMEKRSLKKQKERVEYFKEEIPAELAMAEPEVPDGEFELTEEQLRMQKHLFDLTFGPFGEFQGFTKPKSSQIPLPALRYQINSMQNALQQIQCQYTPNFHGYATQAQRTLIDLYRHPKVWSYWRMENILGNLDFDGNPIKKDNVMMTGFFLVNVTMYMRNTGDLRYAEPGSLTFQNKHGTYKHDVHTVADAIVWNWDHRDYVVYPCEPNFIYSLCNWKAIQSMISYDQIFHTGKWAANADRVYNHFVEEMTSPSGTSYLIKSARMGCGVALPLPNAEAFQIPMYNTEDMDLARKTYAFFRKDSFERDPEGKLHFKAIPFDHGSNSKNYCDTVSLCLFPAKEMGDREAVEAASETLREKCERVEENGAIWYKCSNEANAVMLSASINTRNGWRRAVVDGPAPCTFEGPLLSDAPYPDVMVAKAFSHGKDLELVLYPCDKAGCFATLGLSRMVPGAKYLVAETGETFTADADGTASLNVTIERRTPVTIVPA